MTPNETFALQFFSLSVALFSSLLCGLSAFGIDYRTLILVFFLA
ncbi:putative membrane protein [Collimonas arenae]|nr:putative membrane protein [Collimonas arenae]